MGQFSQVHTIGEIPYWFISFPPTKKKKKKPSMIIIKYNALPDDWTWDGPHMSMCMYLSMSFSLGLLSLYG